MSITEKLHTLAADIEESVDKLRYRLSERLKTGDPIMILPYCGYGTRNRIVLRGRVLEEKGIDPSTDEDTLWENVLAIYNRFESDEIPHALVEARYGEHVQQVRADEEGYFTVDLEVPEGIPSGRLRHELSLRLPEEVRGQRGITATGNFIVPRQDSDFGVISDIDDTILKTDATNLLAAARLTFTGNARTRHPFEGVDAFYRALQAGPSGTKRNPIFYVSSGFWNLYDLLVEFMEINGIPTGPIFLQDYGLDRETFIHDDHIEHKTAAAAEILETYPDLPFVLIGDSGQKDPEVYREVIDRYPGRIRAVYIRKVSLDDRDAEILRIADELKPLDVPMILVPDSAAALDDARQRGLV